MKIKYVQLESDAFLTDLDFIRFTPAERGLYCSLIFFLNSNDGKCEFDPVALSRLCNCDNVRQFEQLWEIVAKKFQSRNGVIKHKRVTKELRKAKKMLHARRKAGLKGAQVTWQNHNKAEGTNNSTATAKERKGNVIEKESKDNYSNTNSNDQSFSSSNPVRTRLSADVQSRALHFNDALMGIIPPRSRSDRTCFHNVTKWLIEGCARGRFNHEIFGRVLDYAKEAKAGQKPAAVFMALLKKELEYTRK
jgi:uncharacterized protein YdaU (DUF1376 family)